MTTLAHGMLTMSRTANGGVDGQVLLDAATRAWIYPPERPAKRWLAKSSSHPFNVLIKVENIGTHR